MSHTHAMDRDCTQIQALLTSHEERLLACYLHIGLDHLAYNAHLGDISALAATAERMQTS